MTCLIQHRAVLGLIHSFPATLASLLYSRHVRPISTSYLRTGSSLCLWRSSFHLPSWLPASPPQVLVQTSLSPQKVPDHSLPSPLSCFIIFHSAFSPLNILYILHKVYAYRLPPCTRMSALGGQGVLFVFVHYFFRPGIYWAFNKYLLNTFSECNRL